MHNKKYNIQKKTQKYVLFTYCAKITKTKDCINLLMFKETIRGNRPLDI